ncbi:MAG: hypothetical protein ACON4R_17355 [Akkermansiaceae bacterium]
MGRFQTVYFLSAVLSGADPKPLFSLGANNNSAREFGRESYRLEEAPGGSTDPDLALFLLGNNSPQSSFLGKNSPALNDRGELTDRHGTQLFIHPTSRKLLEIRFAGPDQKPYTLDDLVCPSPGQ